MNTTNSYPNTQKKIRRDEMKCLCGYKFKDKDLEKNKIYVNADKPDWMTPDVTNYRKVVYICPKCGTLKVEI